MNTGARNCAESCSTVAGSPPAHPMMHAAIWPIVNMPWAMMPSKPDRTGERLVLVQRVLIAAHIGIGLHVLGRHHTGSAGSSSPTATSSKGRIRRRPFDHGRPAVQTWPPASSTRSIVIVTNPVPARTRTDSSRP